LRERPRPVLKRRAGFFDVDEKFGELVEAYAGVEGHDAGRRFLVVGPGLWAPLYRQGTGMSLEDEVCLTGEQKRSLEMREHGFGGFVRWRSLR